jgi:electron transport complex protein RnfG
MDKLLRTVWNNGWLLGLFGMLGAALVAFTHMGTAEQIAANEKAVLMNNIYKLVSPEEMDNKLLEDVISIQVPKLGSEDISVYRARRGGEPVAVIMTPVEAPGYAGTIKLIVGIRADGSLGGIRVLAHKETPGLGDKMEESRSNWILGFTGKSLGNPAPENWKVKRDGGDFDQFTGATITPRSIVTATRRSLEYFAAHKQQLFKPIAPAAGTEP